MACAAIPSRRPVNPSPSVVVALMLTCSGARPAIFAMLVRMAERCGPTFGSSAMMVQSM